MATTYRGIFMPDISIKITNIAQIRSAFDKSPRLMVEELNDAIKKTVFTIQRKSMQNTPVLTGRLRASTTSKFDNLKGEVGTHTNYDVFIHEGTKFMKGRPYLRNAVSDSNRETDDFFKKAVQNVLDKIGREV
jgi:HK97 gp10 family phage protein